jgi:uncharacterized membrane protein YedE/YeeE
VIFMSALNRFQPSYARLFSLSVISALLVFYFWLSSVADGGRDLSLSLILGIFFGVCLQRSRFCFFCVTRDFIDQRDSRGLLGIVAALAIGVLGYALIFGAILPEPLGKRLPPDAHIGPVSWVLALAALVFGAGMALSGSCISAHLYRLGEGAFGSLFALLGAVAGFLLGFKTWNLLYLRVIQEAPVIWLPNYWGYDGAVLAQLGVLAVVAVFLLVKHRPSSAPVDTVNFIEAIITRRWPTYVGGILIGALGAAAYFRIAPLGVTAEIGSIARTVGSAGLWLPERLEGLDSFTGCATVVKETLLSNNGVFILGLVFAAFAAALVAGQFRPQLPDWRSAVRQFFGGVLLGWGSMTALGCTVGTLLSGIMAGALSGWVFGIFCLVGLWLTWCLRRTLAD